MPFKYYQNLKSSLVPENFISRLADLVFCYPSLMLDFHVEKLNVLISLLIGSSEICM